MARVVLDRGGAALLLLLTGVFLLLIALALTLEGRGPVLSRQRCIGQWGREFDLLRFRSGGVDHGVDHGVDTAPAGATPLGRLLRRTALDELPQLINVLKGDLTLVGPRPRAAQDARRGGGPWLGIKPGLTGVGDLRGPRTARTLR